LALTNRGSAWSMKKEYENAIKDFDQAIRLDPKSAFAHHNRGLAWDAKKEPGKALTDYETAIRLDPNYAAAYNSRGDAWLRKKEIGRAIRDFSEAIRLDPNCALALTNRGIAWSIKKDYENAIKDFNQAISLDPTSALALANRRQLEAERQEQRRSLEIARARADAINRAIFAEVKEFVDSHPRIDLPGAGLPSWQLVTRPFRDKASLSRMEHEQMLSFLEGAMMHAQHDADMPIRPVAFRLVMETLRKWDFRYSD
jgi:tetratricopeptide (TPR) repeat protein